MRRQRRANFNQPSLVPMADMLTNTVGIMLFILIFASLSTGAAVVLKHLPRERPAKGNPVWMYCSGGKMVNVDASKIEAQLRQGLGEFTFSNASDWARGYSSHSFETDKLKVTAHAEPEYSNNGFQQGVRLSRETSIQLKPNQGDDEASVLNPGSEFQKLLAAKDKKSDFFFFVVDPESMVLYRSARDQAVKAGFDVGWNPIAPGAPVVFGNNGRQATTY